MLNDAGASGPTPLPRHWARPPGLNEPAPEFRAPSTLGEVGLEDFAGRWLVFFSHPADFTPVCSTELVAFARAYADFQAEECDLLGLSVDGLASHAAWLAELERFGGVRIPFPIIADEGLHVARLYGMIQPGESDVRAVRSVFVIDPDGRVRATLAYPIPTGRDVAELLRLVRALRASAEHQVATPEGWQPGDAALEPTPPRPAAADATPSGGLWYVRERPL
ncbi:MAG: redoxin domain-containing protein [Planctomycetota bacterium]